MYIKSITLDGFKSYAKRVEIKGFDEQFNAITGLNGSGKSNILDAICFVMGISNLSNVRITSLNEYVFKRGQANITRATVSITFDNTNKAQSPPGYEGLDEITISRTIVADTHKNKYTINGVNAQQNKVHDLFRLAKLNINNPHFFIMQGRITKVLNMKPPEILSLIEEAVGTRAYEVKRTTAVKTMMKKEAKLKEINDMIGNKISPELAKLKSERSNYLEYLKIGKEIDHLSRLVIAYTFSQARQRVDNADELADAKRNEIKQIESFIENTKKKIENTQRQIEVMEERIASDEGNDGALAKLDAKYKEARKAENETVAKWNAMKESLRTEQRSLKDTNKSLADDKKLLEKKQKELEKLTQSEGESSADYEAQAAKLKKDIQALRKGMTTADDGSVATLNEQLMKLKRDVNEADTKIKAARNRNRTLEADVKKLRTNIKDASGDYGAQKKELEKLQKEVAAVEKHMEKLEYEPGSERELENKRREHNRSVKALRERVRHIDERLRVDFTYDAPEPNFDHSRVKGPVAKLLTMKDQKYATALETAAGAKLIQVVVDTEKTAKLVLERGNLKRRHVMIPLNKIQGAEITDAQLRRAQKLVGRENVHTAIDLIEFDNAVAPAMRYVFANVFVCSDMETAQKVAFDDQIRKVSVTLDGEMFNPAGTLSGGSKRDGVPLLQSINEAANLREELAASDDQLKEFDRQIEAIGDKPHVYEQLNRQLNEKRSAVDLARMRLERTDQGRLAAELEQKEAEMVECGETVQQCEKVIEEKKVKVTEYEARLEGGGAKWREQERKRLEKELETVNAKAQSSADERSQKEQKVEQTKLEIGDIEKSLVDLEDTKTKTEESIEQTTDQIEVYSTRVEDVKRSTKQAEALVSEFKEKVKEHNKELQGKNAEVDRDTREIQKGELKAQSIEQDIEKLREDTRSAKAEIDRLMRSHEFVAQDNELFGKEGTVYYYNPAEMRDSRDRLARLKDSQSRLSKNVNMTAMNELGRAEKDQQDLISKRDTVERDKKKIETVISEVDELKKVELERAWEEVNKEFGQIFAEVLPGAFAKLQPQAGKNFLDGLEIRVAFNKKWKDSLSELSGGQRSLVALSLILAMLRFNPAPMYILDEIDAALDLSHTQNIGGLIRRKFKESQFVIVSLKDGMFNNANVLIRTHFADGVSCVTVQRQQGSAQSQKDADENQLPRRKRK